MNEHTSAHSDITSVQLHDTFNQLQQSIQEQLPEHQAQLFKPIVNEIPATLPEIQVRTQHFNTFAFLLLLSAIQNAREGTPITIDARPNRYTLDLTFSFSPNPMFVLLTKGTRDSLDKALDTSSMLNASDPFVTFHYARSLGIDLRVNLWVETIPPDKAIIHAYFPLHLPALPADPSAPKILVIEDNRQISMLLELYLKHERYNTISAINGIDGIALAQLEHPDLITLDVMMPEMDGWQALRELKTIESTRHIPIIVISVLRDVQIGFEFGASDYLTKPVNRNDLIASVSRLATPCTPVGLPERGRISLAHVYGKDPDIVSDVASMLAAKCPSCTVSTALKQSELVTKEMADGARVPNVFVIDARENMVAAFAAANRIKLYSPLAHIPIIALTTPELQSFCGIYTSGIFTACMEKAELESYFG